jgi:hypothetical protein
MTAKQSLQDRILKKVFAKELRADGHRRRVARDNTKIKLVVRTVVDKLLGFFKK